MIKERIRSVTASDIMTRDLVTVEPDMPMSSVLGKMKSRDISEIVVVYRNRLLGLIDYRVLSRHKRLSLSALAGHVMFRPPEVTAETPLVDLAEHLINHGLRAIPVAERERPLGIVSRTDVIRYLRGLEDVRSIPISEIMTPDPISVSPRDQCTTAIRIMRDLDERVLPVVENGRLVGVVGIKDILPVMMRPLERRTVGGDGSKEFSPRVEGFMKPPIYVAEDDQLGRALDLMLEHRISAVPVLDGEHLVGIVTQFDVLEFITQFKERPCVYVQISGLDADPDVFDALYETVSRSMERINNWVTPRTLLIHFTELGRREDHGPFDVRARLTTSIGLITAAREGWELYSTLEEVLKALETRVRRNRDRRS